jgi:hypothetical protein
MTYLDLYLERIQLITGGKDDYESIARALLQPIKEEPSNKKFLDYLWTSPDKKLAKLNQDLLSYSGSLNPLEKFLRDGILTSIFTSSNPILQKIFALKIAQLEGERFSKISKDYPPQEILQALISLANIQPQLDHLIKVKQLLEMLKLDGPLLDRLSLENPFLKRFVAPYVMDKRFFDNSYFQAFLPKELLDKSYEDLVIDDLVKEGSSFLNKIFFLSRFSNKIRPFQEEFLTYLYINDPRTFFYLFDDFYSKYPSPYSLNILDFYPEKDDLYKALNRLLQIITPHESLAQLEDLIYKLSLSKLFAFPWQKGPLLEPIFYLLEQPDKAQDWIKMNPQSLMALEGTQSQNLAISTLLLTSFPDKNFLINLYHQEKLWCRLEANHTFIEPPFALVKDARSDLLKDWVKADSKADSLILTRKIYLEEKFIYFYSFAIKYGIFVDYFSFLSNQQLQKSPQDLPEQLYSLLLEGDKLTKNFEYLLEGIAIFYQGKALPAELFAKLLDDYLLLQALDKKDEAYPFKKSLILLLSESRLTSLDCLPLQRLVELGELDFCIAIKQSISKYNSAILSEEDDDSELLAILLTLAFKALCQVNYKEVGKVFVNLTLFFHNWANNLTGNKLATIKVTENKLTLDDIRYYLTFDPIPLEKYQTIDDLTLYNLFFLNKKEKISSKSLISYYNNIVLTITSFISCQKREVFSIKTTLALLILDLQSHQTFLFDENKKQLLIELIKSPEMQSEINNAISPLWQELKKLPFKPINIILSSIDSKVLLKQTVTRAFIDAVITNRLEDINLWLQSSYLEEKNIILLYGLEMAVLTLNLSVIDRILFYKPNLLQDKQVFFADKLPICKNFFSLLKMHLIKDKNCTIISCIAEKLLDYNYPICFIEEASNAGLKDFIKVIMQDSLVQLIKSHLLKLCNLNYNIFYLCDTINFYKRSKTFANERVFITVNSKYKRPEIEKYNLFLFEDQKQDNNLKIFSSIINPAKIDLVKHIVENPLFMTGLYYNITTGGDFSFVALIPQVVTTLNSTMNLASGLVNISLPFLPLIVTSFATGSYLYQLKEEKNYYKMNLRKSIAEDNKFLQYKVAEKKYEYLLYKIKPGLNWNNLPILIEKFYLIDPSILIEVLLNSKKQVELAEALIELVQIINLVIIENNYQKVKHLLTDHLSKKDKNTIYAIINGKIQQKQMLYNNCSISNDLLQEIEKLEITGTIDYNIVRESLYLYILAGERIQTLEEMAKQDQVIHLILEVFTGKEKIIFNEDLQLSF